MTTIDVYSRAGVDKRFATLAAHTDMVARVIRLEAAGPGGAAPNLNNTLPRPADPAGPEAPVIGFIGDSWCTPGAGGAGGAGEETIMPAVAAAALGAGAAISGQGSTGWARVPDPPGTAAVFSDPGRVDRVLDAHPSVLVVVGSVNDNWAVDKDPTGAPAAIAASVKALVDRVRLRAPAMPIIVVGPQPTSEYRAYAGASHKNASAVRSGVASAGGAGNGVWFVDWLGVASAPATRWDAASSPTRMWKRGEVICFDGVDYEVTATTWRPVDTPTAPDPYAASYAASAPVSRRSAVLSGTGAVGKPGASGTRALWLMADETHVNVAGARMFGLELAARILRGVVGLREWVIDKGPAVVGPAPVSPPAQGPAGAAADVRSTRWGVKWGALSAEALGAVLGTAPAAPFSVALPVRASKDTAADRFVVSTPNRIILKAGGNGPQINQSTIAQLKAVEDANGTIATLGEALALLTTPARSPVVVECMDTSSDTAAQYWASYDQSMMRFLLSTVGADAAKRVVVVTGPGLNAARAKTKADAELSKLTRLVVKPVEAGAWSDGEIAALKDVNAVALRPGDGAAALAAVKAHPDRPVLWWAGMTTAAEVRAARTAASAAGLPIVGWLAEAAPAAAEIALKTQPEQP